jgi:hypothetical protein
VTAVEGTHPQVGPEGAHEGEQLEGEGEDEEGEAEGGPEAVFEGTEEEGEGWVRGGVPRRRRAVAVGNSRSGSSRTEGREGAGRVKKAWKKVETTWRKKMAPAQMRLFLMRSRLKYSPVSSISRMLTIT